MPKKKAMKASSIRKRSSAAFAEMDSEVDKEKKASKKASLSKQGRDFFKKRMNETTGEKKKHYSRALEASQKKYAADSTANANFKLPSKKSTKAKKATSPKSRSFYDELDSGVKSLEARGLSHESITSTKRKGSKKRTTTVRQTKKK